MCKEFKRDYLDKVSEVYILFAVLELNYFLIDPTRFLYRYIDLNKIKSWWQPTPWVLTGGSFPIPSKIAAMAIPLEKVGNSRIEYYDSQGVSWFID
jgi:hypothetical protein